MRRRRTLSQQEIRWVNEVITSACRELSVSAADEDYRSEAWRAFYEYYRHCRAVWEPSFWPTVEMLIKRALISEKRENDRIIYGTLSLNVPVVCGAEETFLDVLHTGNGDFTNGTAFRDFIERLPEELGMLARRLSERDTLEEARSWLGWSNAGICSTVERLRDELTRYEAI